MKKILNIIGLPISLMLFSTSAHAQNAGQLKMGLNYSYGLPMGSFKNDLIQNGSARGFNGEIMYGINKQFSAGLSVGYQNFYQKEGRAVYQTGDHQATSAVLSNSITTVPVLAKATFLPLKGNTVVQPYISLGAGVSFNNYDQYLGVFGGTDNQTSFAAEGGLGIHVPFGKWSTSGLNLGAQYNYINYDKFGYKNFNNISLQAGVYFPL